MDPFSITALVCSIISAFTGAAQLFKGRKKEKAAEPLQRSLAIAPPQVQHEYDDDFRRLGTRFGTGDEIGRHQLSMTLIDLQQKMIGTLQSMLNGGSGSYTSLLDTSNASRLATISSLGSQFQRLSQAAPIQKSLKPPTTWKCALWENTNQATLNKDCSATQDGTGKSYSFKKDRKCTVYNETNGDKVWVRFTFSDKNWDENVAYKIEKSALSRVYTGPYKAVINAKCTATRNSDGKSFTFEEGRSCKVYNDVSLSVVYVRFTFKDKTWDEDEAYKVDRKFVSMV